MQAIILVGGRGTRLQPLTNTRPKPMLPIVDRPFLAHQLAYLKEHGVTAVTFACGFLPDAISDYFGDGTDYGLELKYVIEPEPLDTAGAIAFAARTLEPQRLIVCNGDILTDFDLGKLIDSHDKNGAVATIALTPVDEPSRYGLVRTDSDGRVTAFVEKPPPEECDTNLINAGTYVLEKEVIERITPGVRCNIEREIFPALVGSGLYAQHCSGYWNDIGTISSYLAANADVLAGRCGHTPQEGEIWISSEAQVAEDATIGIGSVISAGAVVEPGASVVRSIVLENATIESRSKLEGAIVGERARVLAGVTLGDGVVVAPHETYDR